MDTPLPTVEFVVTPPEVAPYHAEQYVSALRLVVTACERAGLTPSPLNKAPGVYCTIDVRERRVTSAVELSFVREGSPALPLCVVGVNVTTGRVASNSAGCVVCGTGLCPHMAYFCRSLIDAEANRNPEEPVSIVSPLRELFLAMRPAEPQGGVEGGQGIRLALGMVSGGCDDHGLPWLCVYPFTYHEHLSRDGRRLAVPYRSFYGFPRDISPQDKEDLLVLCGIEPYRPCPVLSSLQEEALARVAERGLLWSGGSTGGLDEVVSDTDYTNGRGAPVDSIESADAWHVAPARDGAVGWTFRDGGQYLGIPWFPVGSELVRCGPRAYCVDHERRRLVPIDAPIAPAAAVAQCAFHLKLSEVDRLTQRDLTSLASAGLPLPWRTADAIPLDRAGAVSSVLTIAKAGDGVVDGLGRPLLEGRMQHVYDGVAFPFERSFEVAGRLYGDVDGRLYSLPADAANSLGASRDVFENTVGTAFFQMRRGCVQPVTAKGQSQRAAWINANRYLHVAGLELAIAPEAKLTPDHALSSGQVRPSLVVEEIGSRNLYALGVPVELAGRRVDLGGTLANLVADPRFAALVAGDDADAGQWALDLPDGSVVAVATSELQRLMAPLSELLRNAGGERPVLTALQAANLDAAFDVSRCNKIHDLKARIARLQSCEDLFGDPEPDGFNGSLRDYQKVGLAWLNRLATCGFGGVLADDMGLGKTVQILAHMLWLKSTNRWHAPALVVCPSSLTWNWASEAAKFTPGLRVLQVKGDAAQRKVQLAGWDDYDLVITSYPLVLRDAVALQAFPVGLLVLDEAQQVKNVNGKTSAVLRQIRAERAVVVTGTPVENHLTDFFTLFDYALPGVLGTDKTFRSQFQTPIEVRGDEELKASLVRMVSPFVLRRPKSVVAHELPPKTEEVRMVELLPAQRKLYEQLRGALYGSVQDFVRERGLARASVLVLDAITKLRQVCDDPRLVKMESASAVRGSAKMEALLDLLHDAIADGHKVLVFSSFASMLDLIGERLTQEGVRYLQLTGATRDRKSVVDEFQDGDIPVFLVSLKAGGVGLNLTAADVVVHFDLWWNPAAENQATDRAHRLGQDKPVLVYRFACPDTLDEHILAMQARKADLARAILDAGEATGNAFSAEDIEALFGPR